MSTSGPKSPSSVTSTQVGFFETVPWSDPGDAATSDDSYAIATLAPNDGSYALRCTGFGFTSGDVPGGATIDGILVEVEASQDGDAFNSGSPLVYSGSQIDSFANLGNSAGNAGFIPDGTDTYWPLGDATDTGGVSLTQAMVVDSSFGIDVYFSVAGPPFGSGSTVSVDHVRLTIYYTAGGGAAYTLTAGSGSFTVTGTAAALRRGRKLAAASAAFTLTGTTVSLKRGLKLSAGSGAFALAGQAVALKYGHRISLASGSFALTGTAAVLRRGYPLTAGSGSFALTGTALAFRRTYALAAASRAFALTGTSANFSFGRKLSAGSESFSLTGQPVALKIGRKITAASGSFAFTGTVANFTRGRVLAASSGSFTLAGTAVSFLRSRVMPAGSGSIALTGQDANLRIGHRLAPASGSFSFTGATISFGHGHSGTFEGGVFVCWFTSANIHEREVRHKFWQPPIKLPAGRSIARAQGMRAAAARR